MQALGQPPREIPYEGAALGKLLCSEMKSSRAWTARQSPNRCGARTMMKSG